MLPTVGKFASCDAAGMLHCLYRSGDELELEIFQTKYKAPTDMCGSYVDASSLCSHRTDEAAWDYGHSSEANHLAAVLVALETSSSEWELINSTPTNDGYLFVLRKVDE